MIRALFTAFLLAAAAPYAAQPPALACPHAEARQFDFWLGEWNVLNRNRASDSASFADTGRATDLVHAVAGGCAIVEHWRGEAYGQFILGFSVRAWNARARQWDLVLLWPASGDQSFATLHGDFRHGRGEFFGGRSTPAGDSIRTRFTFSDIRPDALRWQNASSTDGGRSWASNWIMEFTRRDPATDPAPLNAPITGTGRCPEPDHRGLDFLHGEWIGTRHDESTGVDLDVRMRVLPILEGCASIEIGTAGDRHFFAVRSWERARSRWVEYRIDDATAILDRVEAPAANGQLTFESVETPAGSAPAARAVVSRDNDGAVTRTELRRSAGGAWRTVTTTRLSPVLRNR
jgi:hypothetical protein